MRMGECECRWFLKVLIGGSLLFEFHGETGDARKPATEKAVTIVREDVLHRLFPAFPHLFAAGHAGLELEADRQLGPKIGRVPREV